MTLKPIRFNGDEMRAALEGRKTMTRRPLKVQPPIMDHCANIITEIECDWLYANVEPEKQRYGFWIDDQVWESPYSPGDVLWVQENFRLSGSEGFYKVLYRAEEYENCEKYKSEYERLGLDALGRKTVDRAAWENALRDKYCTNWRPSIIMPRFAARLFLEVTSVRVERLQDISCGGYKFKSDVQKEGCPFENDPTKMGMDEIEWFRGTWNKQYAKSVHGFDKNEWVFVYEFERIK